MFCSVKKYNTKDDIVYRFYLCERKRDKETGKIKCSDKLIISIPYDYMIDAHMLKAISRAITRKCKEKGFDKDIYNDIVYDKFTNIRYDFLDLERKKQQEETERRYKEEYQYQEYFNSFCSGNTTTNYTEKEKGYLKKIYRAAAAKLHPDIIKDDGAGMQFLNKLKEEWSI